MRKKHENRLKTDEITFRKSKNEFKFQNGRSSAANFSSTAANFFARQLKYE